MAGFFDELGNTLNNMQGEQREGENVDQFMDRKFPFVGSKLYRLGEFEDSLLGNIPQGLMNVGQGAYEDVTHPLETAKRLSGYVAHPVDTASGIYQHYADRYRDFPTTLKTLRTDPVGVAGDVLPFTMARGAGAMSAANRAARATERARSIKPSAMAREVGATPGGWDIEGTVRPGGNWEDITRLQRTDRSTPWREFSPYFPEPRLNPEDLPYRFGQEENKYHVNPPRAPYPTPESFWDRLADLPEQTQADIRSLRQGGPPLNKFRMNAVMSALNRRGLTMDDLLAADPMVSGMGEGAQYAPPTSSRRLFDKDTGIYPDKDRELMRKALAVSAGAGLGAGAVNLMNRDTGLPPPVLATGEGEPEATTSISPREFPAFPMKAGPMGTPFDSKKTAPVEIARPSRQPLAKPRPVKREAPTRHPTEVRHVAPKRVKPPRVRDSGKRYYGDWRDTEPYASDPIGGFIDELTGQRKTARKPGKQSSSGGFGDLFADGGTVRRPFAEGGEEGRIPILSDIGDALGGMFNSKEPVVAEDQSPRSENFFDRWATNPLSQYLFASGLATMASPHQYPLMAIGEGGIRGLEYMQAVRANNEALRKEREAADQRRRQLKLIESLTRSGGEPAVSTDRPVVSSTPASEPATSGAPAAEPAVSGAPATSGVPTAKPASAPAAEPVAASDDLQSLYETHHRIAQILPSITEADLHRSLESQQRSLQFEISRRLQERKEAIAARQRQEDLALKAQTQRRLEEIASPEHAEEVRKGQKLGERLDEVEANIYDSAQKAPGLIDQFETYKKALENGTLVTGAYGEDRHDTHKTILAATSGWTGRDSDIRSRLGDNMKSGALQQAFEQLGGRLGAGISNSDREAIMQMGISLNRDRQSNIDAIETFQNAQRRKIEAAKFIDEYKATHGGKLDKNFESAFTQWTNAQPSIIPNRVKELFAKQPAPETQESSAMPQEGDIIERDNHKYSWDSASRKYKLVR